MGDSSEIVVESSLPSASDDDEYEFYPKLCMNLQSSEFGFISYGISFCGYCQTCSRGT